MEMQWNEIIISWMNLRYKSKFPHGKLHDRPGSKLLVPCLWTQKLNCVCSGGKEKEQGVCECDPASC